jgi:predicted amidohydrolase YtcJ
MRIAFNHFCGAIAVCCLASACQRTPPPDLVVTGGTIYTLAGESPASAQYEPIVETLVVRDGRIVAAGGKALARRFTGRGTRVLDLQGAFVYPGFVDSHMHLNRLGRSLTEVSLAGTTSWNEAVARVAATAREIEPGAWIVGRDWDHSQWPERGFPDNQLLSRAIPDHPVYLRRTDLHAVVVNDVALAGARITAETPNPPGGRIVRRADGTPSGVLVNTAADLVARLIPGPSPTECKARIRRALARCARAGLTGVHDAGTANRDIDALRELLAADELPLRVYAMWDATPNSDDPDAVEHALRAGPQKFDPTMRFALRTVKFAVDGTMGSRGAAVLAPYADAPDQLGLPQYSAAAFTALVRPVHRAGFQIATHCIGDAANRMVLDTYELLAKESGQANLRCRIEHAQVIAPEDISRFAALGVVASMQPTHCTSDMGWVTDRLGPERVRGAYPWRSLRDAGAVIAAGSDAPVESVDPLLGIYAAVTRQDLDGNPTPGWHSEQCLTRSEALRAFTAWAAWSSFTENDLGTLEVGKLADFVVLDRDILRIAPREIPATRVLETVVGGRTVFPMQQRPWVEK